MFWNIGTLGDVSNDKIMSPLPDIIRAPLFSLIFVA